MVASNTLWPSAHSDMLSRLIATTSLSFAEITTQMNAAFATSYTRNAILGKVYRMGQCNTRPPVTPEEQALKARARITRRSNKKKAERWLAKPSLAERAKRAEEQKRVRAMFDATGTSRTSPGYRKHFPRLPEMSRSELRGMLADAMRNTAAMEVS